MSYQAIATILNQRDLRESALESAIDAAHRWRADLHILCVGINPADPGIYYGNLAGNALQENLKQAQLTATGIAANVRIRMAREDITWSVQTITTMSGGLDDFIADQMRFQDLVILPSPYRAGALRVDSIIFEACVFAAETAVLIVPPNSKDTYFRKVQVNWDDGHEALVASQAALPLLQQALQTEIVLIDPPRHTSDRSDPGGRLAQHLARHGAKPEIFLNAKTGESIAAQLLRRAHERGIDLIVMGAYGHSRLREAVAGGATRDMLKICDLPILMAH